jgi:hypothetical protein
MTNSVQYTLSIAVLADIFCFLQRMNYVHREKCTIIYSVQYIILCKDFSLGGRNLFPLHLSHYTPFSIECTRRYVQVCNVPERIREKCRVYRKEY